MAATRHVYRIYIKAPIGEVWNALIDPAFTRRYFHGTAFDAPPVQGEAYRTSMPSGDGAVDGTIEVLDPPRRLVQTWHTLYDPELTEEPPSRVEWTLTEAGDGLTRLDLIHGDLFRSPKTWARVQHGWVWILDGLKTLLETGSPLPAATEPPEEVDDAGAEWHRTAGITANNGIWDLLANENRSPEDDEELLRHAYASAYHWARAARRGPENGVRGDYMLAKAWVALGNGERALHYADRCMAGCAAAGLADFDLAYAHEARARALGALGRLDEARSARAAAVATPVADPEDLAIVEADLAAGPWFGLDD